MQTARPSSHHLYVHVPFCRLVCAYCDFVTVGGRAIDIPRYVDAVLAELARRPAPGRLETVYLGGGTPSLLPAPAIARLLDAAMDRWGRAPDEVTLEANPSARETPDWPGLRSAGITRLSLGVQSLREAELRTLARGHSAAEARAAFRAARRAGFGNVSIDLIYDIPGQTLDAWRAGLRAALALEPDHLSLYALQLTLEPDAWAAPPRRGALHWRRHLAARQSEDLAADQYALAEELLGGAGYVHYELSSWARPGRESRHNAAYWGRRPYTGIGLGAHSFDGRQRSWNLRDLDDYLAAIEAGGSVVEGAEALDEPTRAFEAMALGLRPLEGLSRAAFAAEFGADPAHRFANPLAEAVAADLIELTDGRLRLTPRGRLLASDAVIGFLPQAAAAAPAG